MSVSLLTSNLKVTGSNILYAPNLTGIGGTLVLQSGQFVLISGAGQGGAGNSNVSVTGSSPIAAPNFSGIGGTIILQSGNFVLVSGAQQTAAVDHGDGINLSGNLTLTGQTAQNNALNLSGSLFTTGSTLIARDLATSGELDRRLVSTGSNAWNNVLNLSGNLNASGRRAWDDATNLSGRLAATGALLSAVQVTGSPIIQNANFTGYGSTFVFYSGGFILISGAPSVAASVDHGDGINLSGRLFATGSSLDNKINLVSGWTDAFFVHRTGDELISGIKSVQQIIYQDGWPIMLGVSNQFPLTGLNGLTTIIGSLNTGNITGKNIILGIGNSVNNSGFLDNGINNTGNIIVGLDNVYDSRRGAGIYGNVLFGIRNYYSSIGTISRSSNNFIYGSENILSTNSGINNYDNQIVGNLNTISINSGVANIKNNIIGTNNIFSADNSNSCSNNNIFGGFNQFLFQSGVQGTLNYVFGGNNILKMNSGSLLNSNAFIGFGNNFDADFIRGISDYNFIIGRANSIGAYSGFNIRRNNIFGFQNEIIQVSQSGQNDNTILGNNNRQRTGSYNILIGHGLEQQQTTGNAVLGLGNSYLLINSGASGAIFNNLNVGIGTNNPTGALHVNGAVCFSGIATGTTANIGGATLPANPVGFVVININGGQFKIPYYNL